MSAELQGTEGPRAQILAGGRFGQPILQRRAHPPTLLTGARPPTYIGTLYQGASALDIDVPKLLLANSEVSATDLVPYESTCCLPNAPAGIVAPGATVWLYRSRVRAGSGDSCLMPWSCRAGFAPSGGRGGDGVVAAKVFQGVSTITPGVGVPWLGSDGSPCSKAEEGRAIVLR